SASPNASMTFKATLRLAMISRCVATQVERSGEESAVSASGSPPLKSTTSVSSATYCFGANTLATAAIVTPTSTLAMSALRRIQRTSKTRSSDIVDLVVRPLEEAFFDEEHVIRLEQIRAAHRDMLLFACFRLTFHDDAPLGTTLGESPARRDRARDGHAAFEPVLAGALHFSVDVELRRTRHIERVAARHDDVLRRIAVDERMQIDGLACAVLTNEHRGIAGFVRIDAACGGNHVEHAVRRLQRVLTGIRDVPEHGHLLALILGDVHEHLRVAQVSALDEAGLEHGFDLRRRASVDFKCADERVRDHPGIADAHFVRELRRAEHAHSEQVARPGSIVAAVGEREVADEERAERDRTEQTPDRAFDRISTHGDPSRRGEGGEEGQWGGR